MAQAEPKTLIDFIASTGLLYYCVFLRKESNCHVYWITLICKGKAFSFEYYKPSKEDCIEVFGGDKEQRPPRLFEVISWIHAPDCLVCDNVELFGFLYRVLGEQKYNYLCSNKK